MARRRGALVRLEIAPEDGMKDVARVVEREVLLERIDAGEVALLSYFGEPLDRLIDAVHVSLVMACVMQFEEFCGIRRLKGVISVAERR